MAARWLEFARNLVSNRLATYGGLTSGQQFIQPTITPEGCGALRDQLSRSPEMAAGYNDAKLWHEREDSAAHQEVNACQDRSRGQLTSYCGSPINRWREVSAQLTRFIAVSDWAGACGLPLGPGSSSTGGPRSASDPERVAQGEELRSATFPVAIAKAQQLTRSGACTEALAWYNRAIQLNPASGPAFYQRAILNMNRGDRQGAMNDLGRFLELNPGDVTAARFRGMIAQGIVQPVGRCQD